MMGESKRFVPGEVNACGILIKTSDTCELSVSRLCEQTCALAPKFLAELTY